MPKKSPITEDFHPYPNSASYRMANTSNSDFFKRMLYLPVVCKVVNYVSDTYDATSKIDNEYFQSVRQATEDGVKVVVFNTIPLTEPFVKPVGGWTAVDSWAVKGLDTIETIIPFIKKTPEEVATETREYVLTTISGENDIPDGVMEAINVRVTTTVRKIRNISDVSQ